MYRLRHWFSPHQTNNHKARILHPLGLAILMCLILVVQLALHFFRLAQPDILGIATDIKVEELLNLTNEQRRKNGLPELVLDPLLTKAAQAKAKHMFEQNYWAHVSPDGTTPWEFFRQANYHYLHAGENLAKEFDKSENVVEAWMASKTHRANILRPDYQDIGLAVVNGKLLGEETTLVVQLFGTKEPAFKASRPIQVTTATSTSAIGRTRTTKAGQMFPQIAGLTHAPLLDVFALIKRWAIFFGFAFLAVLTIDGMILWRRGIVRLSSHNLAHAIFLASLLGAIWFTSIGAIL